MTTTITVSVPSHANWKAKVEYIDHVSDAGAPKGSPRPLAGIVPPGDTATFHAHSSRDVVVSELPLDADGKPVSAEIEPASV